MQNEFRHRVANQNDILIALQEMKAELELSQIDNRHY